MFKQYVTVKTVYGEKLYNVLIPIEDVVIAGAALTSIDYSIGVSEEGNWDSDLGINYDCDEEQADEIATELYGNDELRSKVIELLVNAGVPEELANCADFSEGGMQDEFRASMDFPELTEFVIAAVNE